ncbi:MAG TPA: NADH-quinone oxidoreductase subunit K, partial [Pelomicrobium sp.]|nr:NADH-quinone oxidoreductase subunit K [Pelomicrobium sp.]
MDTLLPLLAGVLVAAGVYLTLARHLLGYVFGLVLIGNAANLVILAAGRLDRYAPAFVPEGAAAPAAAVANALPQALILTAIVIGFGLLAFTLVLILRAYGV